MSEKCTVLENYLCFFSIVGGKEIPVQLSSKLDMHVSTTKFTRASVQPNSKEKPLEHPEAGSHVVAVRAG